MKTAIKILFVLGLLTAICIAQSKNNQSAQDFSGTWILDKKNSIFSYPGMAHEYRSDALDLDDYMLVITQRDTEIKILQSFSYRGEAKRFEITLFSDKRGEANIGPYKLYDFRDHTLETFKLTDVTIKSKTSQKNNKLVRLGSFQIVGPWATNNTILTQTFELSSDGHTLSILTDLTMMVNDSRANQKSKLVFTKQ
jgi:hypothetical protein